MIKSIDEKRKGKVEIDLTGPDGNAFIVLILVLLVKPAGLFAPKKSRGA